jgi:peptidoglycan/LPS O-acetylase OafA/YrhL
MTQSRQAIQISIAYSIPLLLWFSAQLQYVDWNSSVLHPFFRQTWSLLILLQVFTLTLLFANRPRQAMRDDLLAVLFVMLYPLPFIAIFWLTGSTSLKAIIYGFAIVAAVAGIALLIQLCARLFGPNSRLMQTGFAAIHILPAIVIWNFRDLWQGFLDR